MYKLKEMARRGTALAGAVGLLAGIGTSALPSLASADALNPLTERSLTLSSSSPGWSFTDGSGNSTYAYPNSGANGQKTGNVFTFRVSSTATVHALTFQYCTAPAGQCTAPGNNATLSDPNDTTGASGTSDLDVVTSSPTLISSSDWSTISARTEPNKGDANYGVLHAGIPKADNTEGNFVVLTAPSGASPSYVYTSATDWTMSAANQEEPSAVTGKNNMITLKSTTGLALNAGDYVKIAFFGTNTNYITNPGDKAFFVKINDYDDTTHNSPITDTTHIIDGGVTVANVMNQSIAIQTKVLETMDFSVGTVDPDTLTSDGTTTGSAGNELYTADHQTAHGQCDPILTRKDGSQSENTLALGDASAEDSLRTDTTFATHSYWRLSSNSSGGATVYYAGHTLSNTEGDQIRPIGATKAQPLKGTEQFGLAIDNATSGNYTVDAASNTNAHERGADDGTTKNGALDDTATTGWVAYQGANSTFVHNPQLFPLVATSNYSQGAGGINTADSGGIASWFAFDANSNSVPAAIATENSQVVDCVTAKMRYIANIAATTPAGIYTTKINYVASPQY